MIASNASRSIARRAPLDVRACRARALTSPQAIDLDARRRVRRPVRWRREAPFVRADSFAIATRARFLRSVEACASNRAASRLPLYDELSVGLMSFRFPTAHATHDPTASTPYSIPHCSDEKTSSAVEPRNA